MVVTEAFSVKDLLSCLFVLSRIAEEYKGVKTAYQYDILQRARMAKALEAKQTDLSPFLRTIDINVINKADTKIKKNLQMAGGMLGQQNVVLETANPLVRFVTTPMERNL